MWQQELLWFFALFHQEFRKNNPIAFEVLMILAIAHLFGFYNPKQLADFLHVPHQKFYAELKDWSVYHVKKMLLRFMVKQAAEQLKPVLSKSAATRSRAGMTLSIDNSVMDRFGKLLRCTWNWYSGRYHKVIRGQDLLGIVLTINHIAFPLHLLLKNSDNGCISEGLLKSSLRAKATMSLPFMGKNRVHWYGKKP